MSGDVCGRGVQTPCVEGNSRIPVASPSYGFRRCSSMRLRGERRPQHLPLHNGPEFYPEDGGTEQRNYRQHHLRAGVTALTARPPIINGNTAHQLGNSSRTRSLVSKRPSLHVCRNRAKNYDATLESISFDSFV